MNLTGSRKAVHFVLAVIALLSATTSLHAYTRVGSMVGDIRQADLIVFGDVSLQANTTTYRDNFMVTPLEVLKGDASLVGKMLNMPNGQRMLICGGPTLSVGPQVVLLRKDRESNWVAIEGYSGAIIPRLRCLIEILRMSPEAAQVQKFMELIQNSNNACPEVDWKENELDQDMTSALKAIRDKNSFPVVEKALPTMPSHFQVFALQWMSETEDFRAIPALVHSLDSQDRAVREEAAQGLVKFFPGAPGVTEALADWGTLVLSFLVRKPTEGLWFFHPGRLGDVGSFVPCPKAY